MSKPTAIITAATPAATPTTPSQTPAELRKLSQSIESGGRADSLVPLFYQLYEAQAQSKAIPLRILKSVDMHDEDRLVVVGAGPGIGKSALVGSETAIDLAAQGAHVVVCNYEMRQFGSIQRLHACASFRSSTPILMDSIIDKSASPELLSQIYQQQVASKTGTITFARPRSPKDLAAILKDIRDEFPNDKIVNIYDYLQRMPWFSDSNKEQRHIVSATLRAIQDVGAEFDCHSIVISSLNRGGYGKSDLDAFREAGEIESDADMAILLNLGEKTTKGEYSPISDPAKIIEARKKPIVDLLVCVIKQRHSLESSYHLRFHKKFQAFESMSEAGQVPQECQTKPEGEGGKPSAAVSENDSAGENAETATTEKAKEKQTAAKTTSAPKSKMKTAKEMRPKKDVLLQFALLNHFKKGGHI